MGWLGTRMGPSAPGWFFLAAGGDAKVLPASLRCHSIGTRDPPGPGLEEGAPAPPARQDAALGPGKLRQPRGMVIGGSGAASPRRRPPSRGRCEALDTADTNPRSSQPSRGSCRGALTRRQSQTRSLRRRWPRAVGGSGTAASLHHGLAIKLLLAMPPSTSATRQRPRRHPAAVTEGAGAPGSGGRDGGTRGSSVTNRIRKSYRKGKA